jgi:hypothetical protein
VSAAQTTSGLQQSVPHCTSPPLQVSTHVPFTQLWPVVQQSVPHLGPGAPVPPSGAGLREGQPHWLPLHVPMPVPVAQMPPGAPHVSTGQHVVPQSRPSPAGQHTPAGSASLLAHAGSADGQPPPAHATTSPGGSVAPWPTEQPVVALHAEHATPAGAQ